MAGINEQLLSIYDALKNRWEQKQSEFCLLPQNIGNYFFWIGTKDCIIGSNDGHYEVITYNDGQSVCLEVHCERGPLRKKNLDIIDQTNDFRKVPNHPDRRILTSMTAEWDCSQNDNSTICDNIENVLSIMNNTLHDKIANNHKMEDLSRYFNLLKTNYNIVLTGAPGTGKSFLAHEIAAQWLGISKPYAEEDNWSDEEKRLYKEHVGFVQFHPSYDYTDFVEGLRPKKEGEGFEYKPGVFKEFCKKAINKQSATEPSFQVLFDSILNDIKSEQIKTYSFMRGGTRPLRIIDNKIEYQASDDPSRQWRKYINTHLESMYNTIVSESKFDINIDTTTLHALIKKATNGQTNTIDSAYAWFLKSLIDRRNKIIAKDKVLVEKPYIFIIDEINRGELSKIFGELFFSIDPGYRGTKGKVNTQYQNMIASNDVFAEGFYVPENVYIIGTMNDIDRSVESMDFAMRRRFTWLEVKPEDRVCMWGNEDWTEKAGRIMKAINEKISNIPGLGEAYQVGPAYFKKLKDYGGDESKLWDLHISILIKEYLRGFPKAKEFFEELQNIYSEAATEPNNNPETYE